MSFLDSEEFKKISDAFNETMDAYQKEADELWESLPHDDRLKLFCAVVRILSKAELEDNRSYRGVLYSAFGFDEGSYAVAQCAGFLALHNSIFTVEELQKLVSGFVKEGMDITKDNLDEQVSDYIIKKHYF